MCMESELMHLLADVVDSHYCNRRYKGDSYTYSAETPGNYSLMEEYF